MVFQWNTEIKLIQVIKKPISKMNFKIQEEPWKNYITYLSIYKKKIQEKIKNLLHYQNLFNKFLIIIN